jgi:hypothetical protein
MSKYVLTNHDPWHKTLKDCFTKTGYEISGSYEDGVYLSVFHKLNFHNKNYFTKNGDFIACSGTALYKGKLLSDCLDVLLDHLIINSIDTIRHDLSGCYSIVYNHNGQIQLFTDASGTYAIYYYFQDDHYLITNTYYHIARCTNVSLNKLSFMEQIFEYGIIDNDTPFHHIYRLLGHEYLSIDSDQIRTCKFLSRPIYASFSTEEACIQQLTNELKTVSATRTCNFQNQLYFCTGGVDSRLILAASLSSGAKPIVANWQGEPVAMNTKPEDETIARELASIGNLPFIGFNIGESTSGHRKDINQIDYEKYGEYALQYGNNQKWFDIFTQVSPHADFVDFGYFGESLKKWELLEANYKAPMTIYDYCEMYLHRQRIKNMKDNFRDYHHYQQKLLSKLTALAQDLNLDTTNLRKEDCMKLYFYYRLHADTRINNIANLFCYSSIMLAESQLAERINAIPYAYKQNDSLCLKLINQLYPSLLNVTFYSHCRFMTFEKNKMILRENLKYQYHNSSIRKKIIHSLSSNQVGRKLVMLWHGWKTSDEQTFIRKYVKLLNKQGFYTSIGLTLHEDSFAYVPIYINLFLSADMIMHVQQKDR